VNPRIRHEFEYEIPHADGVALMKIAAERGTIINKTRYFKRSAEGLVWEIDVFKGDFEGLIMAEIETPKANTKIELPVWVGKEVTSIKKYSNSSLFHNGL
jgi:CYTH domain-containing protein